MMCEERLQPTSTEEAVESKRLLCRSVQGPSSSLGRWLRRGLPQGEEGPGGLFPWLMVTVSCSGNTKKETNKRRLLL